MPRVCILTDSTAQFTDPVFPGLDLVNVIPLRIQYQNQIFFDGKDLKTICLPQTEQGENGPFILAPSIEDFRQAFIGLGRKYNEIIVILMSSLLSPTYAVALEAASSVKGPASIHFIDSQTTAVGLGLIVQAAAGAAEQSATTTRISRLVRGLIPRIYTVFCLQSLSYLYRSGHLDPAQAIVGEMLGITPFFAMENGHLVPNQKVRNSRHLVDILHEFISEFSHLKHIAIVQGVPPFEQEAHNLRERINGNFPAASFSEHTLGAALATILGPKSLGVVAMEYCPDA
jgi:DegV family protein with EDD domain